MSLEASSVHLARREPSLEVVVLAHRVAEQVRALIQCTGATDGADVLVYQLATIISLKKVEAKRRK
jgi:hypothetical protein